MEIAGTFTTHIQAYHRPATKVITTGLDISWIRPGGGLSSSDLEPIVLALSQNKTKKEK